MPNELYKRACAMQDTLVADRRWLHQHAELSFQEVQTSAYIETALQETGRALRISRPTPTSVMAVLSTGRPGRRLAVRADIDALPMCETNQHAFVSLDPGAMHSCGHDGHAAMLLGTIRLMLQDLENLCGEVRFIFQHAEELPPGGAVEVIEAGVLEGIDEVYGLHLTSTLPTGKFGVKEGVLTSSTDRFDITVHGKGGHSSMPQECIDPLLVGAYILTALQSIPSRRLRPADAAVVSVCQLAGGSAYNIIPDTMQLTGSVRSFDTAVQAEIRRLVGEIAAGTAGAHGATVSYEYTEGYPSIINDPALTGIAEKVINDTFGPGGIVHIPAMTPGDDFSYYHQHRPGFFLELGAACPEKGIDAPHHNPAYRLDEDALPIGAAYMAALLEARLRGD